MMRLLSASVVLLFTASAAEATDKPRLIVTTDIGGDPDDQQSLIRLLHHAADFEIEGLIASAAGVIGELSEDKTRPELIREIVEAYGKVQPHLRLHDPGFPPAKELLERVTSGNPVRGVKNIGDGKDTDGSRLIAAAVDRNDPRPVNVAIWGGSTELAQALWTARKTRTPEGLKAFLAKLRVYSIGHQDDTGPWIVENFPSLHYVLPMAPPKRDKREAAYRGMYLGGDESLTSREWVDRNLRKDHGPLGALFPTRTWTEPNRNGCLKEGDTPSWFHFLPIGLGDPEHPEWGGWGGRFKREKGGLYRDGPDTVGSETHVRASVYRWRPAYQSEFAARADWCVKPFAEANHPPHVKLNGDSTVNVLRLNAKPGETLKLSAEGTRDPDGHAVTYRWWVYREAGTYAKPVTLADSATSAASVMLPEDATGASVHLVLEVTDRGEPPITRYRRAVIEVK